MIAMIDYDAGNLRSVEKAFEALGENLIITGEPEVLLKADKVILPGVGSFGQAMENLGRFGLIEPIHQIVEKGTPFFGICLGQQLLFDSSEESPGVKGLGILKGRVLKIPDCEGLKIPHMGWNSLEITPGTKLFKGIKSGAYVYFVHSYYVKAEDEEEVAAATDYSTRIHAAVETRNVYACQFHPEKSSEAGLQILRNFISL